MSLTNSVKFHNVFQTLKFSQIHQQFLNKELITFARILVLSSVSKESIVIYKSKLWFLISNKHI